MSDGFTSSYCVAGLALIAVRILELSSVVFSVETLCLSQACGLYYVIWVIVLPRLGGYEIVEEVQELDGGARNTRLVRRYKHIQDEDS